jgi:hypothetical protein
MLDRLIGTQPISKDAIGAAADWGYSLSMRVQQRRLLVGQGVCTGSTSLSWPLIRLISDRRTADSVFCFTLAISAGICVHDVCAGQARMGPRW